MNVDRRRFLAGSGAALAGAAVMGRALGADAPAATQKAQPAPAPAPADKWADVRAQFRLAPDLVHLSTFFLVSHPRAVREAIERYRDQLDADPVATVQKGAFGRHDGENLLLRVKNMAARYLGGSPQEVALTQSTTMGLGLAYQGLRLAPGDEILLSTHDHFVHHEAARLAAERTGATVRRVPLYDRLEDLPAITAAQITERVRAAIGPATRVLGVTWVHSSSGLKVPLRAIAGVVREVNARRPERERVLVVVDGVHGFGVEDETIAETGVDVFVAGTHKWIFGPRGTGIVWAPERVWALLRPTLPTFDGTELRAAWQAGRPPDTPARASWFTPGGFHAYEHEWAVADAFAFHESIGRRAIAYRIHELNGRIKDGLAALPNVKLWTPRSRELSAGMVGFDVDGMTADEVVRRLGAARIVASTSPYARPVARLAAGIMNTPQEVDAAVAAVAALGPAAG